MNLKQWLAIVMVVLGVIAASTAQLTDLLGPNSAKAVIGIAGMLNSVLAGIMGIITSQTGTIKDVQSMPGVDRIVVNEQANTTLATMAVDPKNEKIEASPEAEAAVKATAHG